MKTLRMFAAAACMIMLAACGGGAKEGATEKAVDDAAFYATQPVVSGQYRATNYDITGTNPRKGKFDGRLLISLSPSEQSGMYVYENGNRTKIDYKIVLKAPFEKGDSGVYKTVDVNDLPVTISADSAGYVLAFQKSNADVKIGFESEPMSTGSAVEVMEKISSTIQKNK